MRSQRYRSWLKSATPGKAPHLVKHMNTQYTQYTHNYTKNGRFCAIPKFFRQLKQRIFKICFKKKSHCDSLLYFRNTTTLSLREKIHYSISDFRQNSTTELSLLRDFKCTYLNFFSSAFYSVLRYHPQEFESV